MCIIDSSYHCKSKGTKTSEATCHSFFQAPVYFVFVLSYPWWGLPNYIRCRHSKTWIHCWTCVNQATPALEEGQRQKNIFLIPQKLVRFKINKQDLVWFVVFLNLCFTNPPSNAAKPESKNHETLTFVSLF